MVSATETTRAPVIASCDRQTIFPRTRRRFATPERLPHRRGVEREISATGLMLPGFHLLVASETRQRPEPLQSLPGGLGSLRASLTPNSLATATTDMNFIYFGHWSEPLRLNTGTMTLAATLLANFRTIHFPRSEDRLMPFPTTTPDWWTKAKARFADRRAVDAYRQRLRRELVAHGHRLVLDHLESNPEGGWRLHIFVADENALSLLADISEGQCGAGDPLDFDPEEFVADHLNRLERLGSDFN
jgi:hypothetical protein